jgi:exosortase E/protease (VPEID-CTERM system)
LANSGSTGRIVHGAAHDPHGAVFRAAPHVVVAPTTRRVLLLVLLLFELLGLMAAFDTQPLDSIPTAWAQIVNWSPQYLRLAISIAVIAVVLASAQRPSGIRAVLGQPDAAAGVMGFAIHVAGLVLFALVTDIIVSTGTLYHAHSALWTVAWLAAGVVTFAAWALTAWPADSWWRGIRLERSTIGAATVVGTIVWAAGFLAEDFWVPLARYTFNTAAWVLGFFYDDVISRPRRLVIGTPAFRVRVSPECSGYEGIGLVLGFLSVYLWLFRKDIRFPGALILLPIAAAAAWLANVVRIVSLIALGTEGWPDIAQGGFHTQAGWIIFNAIALGFVAMTSHFGYFRKTAPGSTQAALATTHADGDATVAYVGPFLAVTATGMLTGAVSAGFDWLYPVRVMAVAAVLWAYRAHYAHVRWSYSWWSLGIGLLTFVLWVALVPADANPNGIWPAALQAMPFHWAVMWMVVRTAGYVIAAPVAEELAFRGFLTRWFMRSDFQEVPAGEFSWVSFLVSSVLFGALHGSLWVPGTVAGMLFAVAMYRRRSLADAVWAHATANALIALYAFVTGQWWVWA